MKAALFCTAFALLGSQDPCAGCDEGLALEYQKCTGAHGNPCALVGTADNAKESWQVGQVVEGGLGKKKDVGCCLKKEKHDRCMQCKSMDCSHNTCTVNKKYYSERKMEEDTTGWEDKAKEESGWGF